MDKLTISRILVENKYLLPVTKADTGVHVVDIPKAAEVLNELFQQKLKQCSVIGSGGSFDVYPSPLMVQKVRVQFRFPKSKKKRIRIKWAKRPENWKVADKHSAVQIGNKLMVSPAIYQKLIDSRRLL